jgi:hypothetical protein
MILVIVLVSPAAAPAHPFVIGFLHFLHLLVKVVLVDGIALSDAYLVASIMLQNTDVDKFVI